MKPIFNPPAGAGYGVDPFQITPSSQQPRVARYVGLVQSQPSAGRIPQFEGFTARQLSCVSSLLRTWSVPVHTAQLMLAVLKELAMTEGRMHSDQAAACLNCSQEQLEEQFKQGNLSRMTKYGQTLWLTHEVEHLAVGRINHE